jgi:hypothetical protein
MEQAPQRKPTAKYVYVKDQEGIEYVCRADALKSPDELDEEEKAACMQPPGDG